MNRRTFLKSLATACGAAVVCPGELLKTDPWIKAAALRKKNAAMGGRLIHRVVIIDEFAKIETNWKCLEWQIYNDPFINMPVVRLNETT